MQPRNDVLDLISHSCCYTAELEIRPLRVITRGLAWSLALRVGASFFMPPKNRVDDLICTSNVGRIQAANANLSVSPGMCPVAAMQ